MYYLVTTKESFKVKFHSNIHFFLKNTTLSEQTHNQMTTQDASLCSLLEFGMKLQYVPGTQVLHYFSNINLKEFFFS